MSELLALLLNFNKGSIAAMTPRPNCHVLAGNRKKLGSKCPLFIKKMLIKKEMNVTNKTEKILLLSFENFLNIKKNIIGKNK